MKNRFNILRFKLNQGCRVNNINQRSVSILSTMVRSVNQKDSINLIGSCCVYFNEIDFNQVNTFVNNDIRIIKENNSFLSINSIDEDIKIFIVHLVLDIYKEVITEEKIYSHIYVLKMGILEYLTGVGNKGSLFNKIFIDRMVNGEKYFKTNPLFIFSEMDWSVVVLLFKLRNIILSGGNTQYRHKISTIQLKLLRYLELITLKNEELINWCVINNMKDINNSSPFIDKYIYKVIKNKKSLNAYLNNSFYFNFINENYMNLNENIMEQYKGEEQNTHINILKEYVSYNKEILLLLSVVKNLISFKKLKLSLEEKLVNLKNTYKESEFKVIDSGMSKYIDKVNRRMKSQNELRLLESKNLIEVKNNILSLENFIESKKLIINPKLISFIENNEINKGVNYLFKNRKIRGIKINNNINLIQKREFNHSSNLINESIRNKEISNLSVLVNNISNNLDKDNNIGKNDSQIDLNNPVSHFINIYLNNPMYTRLSQILNNKEITNYYKQVQIEETLTDFWRKEIYKLFESKNELIKSKYGMNIIFSNLKNLERDIYDLKFRDNRLLKFKKYRKLLLAVNISDIISIVISNVVPHCIKYANLNKQNIASLYEKIGKDIIKIFYNKEWERYLESLKNLKFNSISESLNSESNGIFYSIDLDKFNICLISSREERKMENIIIFDKNLSSDKFRSKLKDIIGEISEIEYFKLGSDLTEYIAEKSLLFKLDNIRNDDGTVNRILIPGEKLNINLLNILTYESELLPMVNLPEKWCVDIKNINAVELSLKENEQSIVISNYGGFISNKNNKSSFIRKSHKNVGVSRLKNKDIINTINYLSSIKYSINNNVLNYIFKLLINNDERIYNLINLDLHPKTKEIHKLTITKNMIELNLIQKHNSKYYSDKTVLQTAFLFSKLTNENENCIYFPHFIDWRGRLYTNTGYFSFQGGELARSLIFFKIGIKLNNYGLEALKIYTANCFGLNKQSYNQRLKWVDLNLNHIRIIEPDLIFQANEPLLFLACCFELKGYYEDPNNFISQLPIYLDATCNGLQHLSSMINDTNLAKYVNIIKSGRDDLPNDVYGFMVTKVVDEIKELIQKNPEFAKLGYLKITRKFIKRGIMTIPYGVTVRGISEQLKSDHFQINKINGKRCYLLNNKEFNIIDTDIYLNDKEINQLAKIIHDILYKSFPNLTKLVDYLKNMNRFLKKLNLSPIWLSPSGVIIEQKYVENIKIALVSSILGNRKSITISTPNKNKINLKKQNEGIIPNIVHSLDASNIALLIKELIENKNNINILTIHDCFATNGNNVELMILQVKLAFLLLYSNNEFVKLYHNFIMEYLTKSGYLIDDKNRIILNNQKIKIPETPDFQIKNDFKENILGSQYFIN